MGFWGGRKIVTNAVTVFVHAFTVWLFIVAVPTTVLHGIHSLYGDEPYPLYIDPTTPFWRQGEGLEKVLSVWSPRSLAVVRLVERQQVSRFVLSKELFDDVLVLQRVTEATYPKRVLPPAYLLRNSSYLVHLGTPPAGCQLVDQIEDVAISSCRVDNH
jgi:hypothetical protein